MARNGKKKEENIQKLKNLEEEKKSKKESIQKEKISRVGSKKSFINTETQVITEEKIKDTESKKQNYIFICKMKSQILIDIY